MFHVCDQIGTKVPAGMHLFYHLLLLWTLSPPAWKFQENFPILSDSQSSSHLSLQSSVMGFSFSFGCHNRMPLVVQTKKLLHPDSIAGFCGVFLLYLQTAATAVSSWGLPECAQCVCPFLVKTPRKACYKHIAPFNRGPVSKYGHEDVNTGSWWDMAQSVWRIT